MPDYTSPIPSLPFPEDDVSLIIENEPLMRIDQSKGILIDMQYAKEGISGAVSDCYLRKTVYELLQKALTYLPEGMQFKIYDAWRPLSVQQHLYYRYCDQINAENNNLGAEDLKNKAKSFVSFPSDNPLTPPVHCTGGAIDLTIVDSSGKELTMGTEFDDFHDKAHTAYFENTDNNKIINNRRLLYHTMLAAGFTNLSTEWWHYDYGTRFWGCYKNKPSKYTGIFSLDEIK